MTSFIQNNSSRLKLLASALVVMLLTSCGEDIVLLNPKGQVGVHELTLMTICVGVMLCVVIPVIIATLYFAVKYRASNTSAEYKPEWAHSNTIEAFVWGVPIMIIIVLATLTYIYTHKVDPYRPLETAYSGKPLDGSMTIQVVALDWKWLFIYPEENIASINEIYFPINTEVKFKVTSDTGMNSFFIPQLGSMVYAMGGMETQLHLDAFEVGKYKGMAANYSGHGHAHNKFTAHAVSQQDYQQWLAKVRASGEVLDTEEVAVISYDQKERAIVDKKEAWVGNALSHKVYPVKHYATVEPANMFYDTFISKYAGMTLRDREMKKLMDELCKVGV